jgi:Lar family restriction alleviation protein
MSDRTLLPCPFCGSPDVEIAYPPEPEDHETGGTIACRACSVGCDFECGSRGVSYLVEQWNRRASGWISVEERLPDFDQFVYLWLPNGEAWRAGASAELCVGFRSFEAEPDDDDCGWRWALIGLRIGFFPGDAAPELVTHWMPLPEPPA